MRKLVLFIACSLDGCIARENGDVDWLFTDQDYGYAEFLSAAPDVRHRACSAYVPAKGDVTIRCRSGAACCKTSAAMIAANGITHPALP